MTIRKDIFNGKSNVAVVFSIALGLHYFLNPSESSSGPQMARWIQLAAGFLSFVIVHLFDRSRQQNSRLIYLYAPICSWFTVINFPNNIVALFSLFMLLGSGFIFATRLRSESKGGPVSDAISLLLIFWVLSLLSQIVIYVFTGVVVDFHQLLHPYSEGRVQDIGSLIRFSGVQIEPGTYSGWVYGLVFLRGISSRKLFDGLSVVCILSILLTLSAWGIIAVLLYFLAYIFYQYYSGRFVSRGYGIVLFILLSTLLIIFYFQFSDNFASALQYLEFRSTLVDDSSGAKILAYDGFLSHLLRIAVIGTPVDYNYCNGCEHSQDVGIFINLAMRAGLVFATVIFIAIGRNVIERYGVVACLTLVPLAFAKYFYFESLFWAIVGFCLLNLMSGRKRAHPNTASVSGNMF
jgi:hypothetical protein